MYCLLLTFMLIRHLFHVQQYVFCILLVVFEDNYGVPFSLWLSHYSFNIQTMLILQSIILRWALW